MKKILLSLAAIGAVVAGRRAGRRPAVARLWPGRGPLRRATTSPIAAAG